MPELHITKPGHRSGYGAHAGHELRISAGEGETITIGLKSPSDNPTNGGRETSIRLTPDEARRVVNHLSAFATPSQREPDNG